MSLWMGFLRLSTYINGQKTKTEGFSGDFTGEGRLLGGNFCFLINWLLIFFYLKQYIKLKFFNKKTSLGIYLIDKNKVIYSHLEQEWGELVKNDEILNAIKKI